MPTKAATAPKAPVNCRAQPPGSHPPGDRKPDLSSLSAGDALLTRRVKAKSDRHAVVVRFSKSRRRYERQGLLVEPQALTEAQRELARQTR